IREKREAASSQISELRANVHPPEDTVPTGDDDDTEDDVEDESDDDESDDEDDDDEVVAPTSADVVSVAASTKQPSIRQLARAQTLPVKRNKRVMARVSTRLVAAGDIPGFGVGQEITNDADL